MKIQKQVSFKKDKLAREISRAIVLASSFCLLPIANAQITEVMVTATKREENVQDIPISVSAFSGEFIEESGISSLQDLGSYAPNLNLSRSSQVANQRIAIRGVGSVGNNAIDPSVAVFIDGVYYPRPGAVVGNLQDIQTVEVLRGPQGTLFGRNASMGALNISTKAPDFEQTTDISLSAGNYGAFGIGATVNGGLSDNIAGRLSIQHSDRDGFGSSTFDGADIGQWKDTGIRGSLLFNISDSTQAVLRADWKKIENNGILLDTIPSSVLPRYQTTLGALLDPSFADGVGNGPQPDVTNAYDHVVNQQHRDMAEDDQWGLALDIDGQLENHTWRSISSIREWENDTFESAIRLPADILPRQTAYTAETYSQEFQLISDTDGPFQYVTGVYLYHEEYVIDQQFNFGADFCAPIVFNKTFFQVLGAGGSPAVAEPTAAGTAAFCGAGPQDAAFYTDFNHDVDSMAIFAQGTVDMTDRLSATLGMRYTDDDKTGRFDQVVANPIAGPAGLGLRVSEATDLNFSDSQVTAMANLEFHATDDILFFTSISTGYKAGGFNSDGAAIALGNRRTFDSEDVTNVEFGMKSTLLDNTMTFNATLYSTDIGNFQDRLFDGLSFVVVNAGNLRQEGLEIDVNYQPNDNFTAIVGASYLDSEFKTYGGGTNLPGFNQAVSQDLSGARNNFSPDLQASVILQWEDSLTDSLNWFVRGEYNYVAEQSVSAQTDNNPASLQDSYGLYNLGVGIANVDGTWDLTLQGRNMGDEGYCQTTFYQPLAGTLGLVDPVTGNAMTRCVTGDPSTYTLRLGYHF